MTVAMMRSMNGYLIGVGVGVRAGVQGQAKLEELEGGQPKLPQDYLVDGSAFLFYFATPFFSIVMKCNLLLTSVRFFSLFHPHSLSARHL